MMQIKYHGGDAFTLKTAGAAISLTPKPSIDGFELPGPGEYEKAGVSVMGIPENGSIIYLIRAEEMTIGYLGRIAKKLPQGVIKEMGNIDILFLPLGEEGSLPVKEAVDLLSEIDPRVVIPMLYSDLTEFKKSEGVTDGETDSYKVKRSDLPEEERKIVILKQEKS